MKLIRTQTGGYPRTMDPILSLQAEMITGINAPFANLGVDLVLQGCTVIDNLNGTVNIAAGIMYVSGQVLRFDAATNIAADGSQAIVVGSTVDSQPPVVFGNQTAYSLYTEQKAIIVPQDPNNHAQIKIGKTLYTFQKYLADQVNTAVVNQINSSLTSIVNNSVQSLINASYPKGSIKEVYDFDGTFTKNFDGQGIGKVYPWVGWALDIGGGNGTVGSQGRVTVGVGTFNDVSGNRTLTINSGDLLGEASHLLTIPEMPTHSHDQQADVYHTQGGGTSPAAGSGGNGTRGTTFPTGGGQAHNNMQPSIGVYRVVKIV